jgi:hypothetical protein
VLQELSHGAKMPQYFFKILVPLAKIFLKNLEQDSANRCQSAFITMQYLALNEGNIFKN